MHRHGKNDIPRTLKQAFDLRQATSGASLVEEIEEILGRSKAILSQAESNGDLRLSLSAIREIGRLLTLHGKATGELPAPLKGTAATPIFQIDRNNAPKLNIADIQTILPEDKVSELPPDRTGVEEDDDEWGARFTPDQKEAGSVRRKLLGSDKRAARKEQFKTH